MGRVLSQKDVYTSNYSACCGKFVIRNVRELGNQRYEQLEGYRCSRCNKPTTVYGNPVSPQIRVAPKVNHTKTQAKPLPTTLEALPKICKAYAEDMNIAYVDFRHAPSTKSVWVFGFEEGYEDPEDGNLQIQLTYSMVNEYVQKKGFKLSDSLK